MRWKPHSDGSRADSVSAMDIDPDRLARQAASEGIDKLVVGALIHDHGRVLILRRSAVDDFLPEIEELPSGGVEHGEDFLQALARELDEETGPRRLGPSLGYVDFFDYVTGSGRTARQFTFSLPYDGAPIRLSPEHTAHRWITTATSPFPPASGPPCWVPCAATRCDHRMGRASAQGASSSPDRRPDKTSVRAVDDGGPGICTTAVSCCSDRGRTYRNDQPDQRRTVTRITGPSGERSRYWRYRAVRCASAS